MNEELQSKIAGLVTELESGIEFTKGQAPVIVEQILKYDTISAIFWLSVGLIVLIASSYFIYKFALEMDDAIFPMLVFCIVGLFVACANAVTILKIYIAPNLYILDYLRDMV